MPIKTYTDAVSTRSATTTPQSEAIPGREAEMAPNNAGGVTFVLDDWGRFRRFLVLGAEGGTYYVGEKKLVKENAACVERLLKVDGLRVVKEVVEMSVSGRAPKTGPILFSFAAAMKLGDDATKKAAFAAFGQVCRIGTHVFDLATAVQVFGGWGRATKRAFAQWYTSQEAKDLAYNLVKYQSRNGWSSRDILRLAKPEGHVKGGDIDQALAWATKGTAPTAEALGIILAFEDAKKEGATALDIVRLIGKYNLPRECVPTEMLNEKSIWEALLVNGGKGMPITAMIRNLPKMTEVGLLGPLSDATKLVVKYLTDAERIKKGKVHPLAILVAVKTYAQGHGEKGSLTWTPVQPIVDALDKAFYLAFGNVTPTGKSILLALDVSGSMEAGTVAGLPGVTPRVASAAMALVTAAVEPNHAIVGFTAKNGYGGGNMKDFWASPNAGSSFGGQNGISQVPISPRMRLDDACKAIAALPMGGTDCALPMLYALEKGLKVDAFIVYTDNETWAGTVQPVQALTKYRTATGINARLIVVGLTATEFTIADPADTGMLDVVGMDSAAPEIMSEFISGRL